jgi:hypothetical protein
LNRGPGREFAEEHHGGAAGVINETYFFMALAGLIACAIADDFIGREAADFTGLAAQD